MVHLVKLKAQLKAAEEAATQAGEVLMGYYGRVHVDVKADKTQVTEADVKAEEKIRSILSARFPRYSFLGEETGLHRESSEFMWVVDPLDGTTNFTIRNPFFAVSIALVQNRTARLGVVHYPAVGETFTAVDGCGSCLNNGRVRVSTRDRIEDSILTFCHSPDRRSVLEISGMFRRLKLVNDKVRQMGAASLELGYVGCGRVDAFMMTQTRLWDVAAGALIVKEAGGIVTDFNGQPFNFDSRSILATNGRIHDAMLKLLRPAASRHGRRNT